MSRPSHNRHQIRALNAGEFGTAYYSNFSCHRYSKNSRSSMLVRGSELSKQAVNRTADVTI